MNDKIKNLLEGNFEYDNGALDFSCMRIEISVSQDEKREGSFIVYGPKGKSTYGTVFSTESRMQCYTDYFSGEEEEITYCFDATGLEEGDTVQGRICFISNQGEYYLPFTVTVSYQKIDSSMGIIKNLFHFTNLAKANWDEAVKLFYSPDFVHMFVGSDRQYKDMYKGLSMYPGNPQNMEEFLLAINKKQKMEYFLDTNQFDVENPKEDEEYKLLLKRNGWGYTSFQIVSEENTVLLEKKQYGEEDFLGNNCWIHFKLDLNRIHGGNNYDKIMIVTPYDTLEVQVKIDIQTVNVFGKSQRIKKRMIVELMEYYQAFRLKKISVTTWLKETKLILERALSLDDKDISFRLFQAQLLISQDRFNEAQWILEHVSKTLDEENEDFILEAYYLYLTTLVKKEEKYTDEIAFQVEELYKRNQNWRIAWILLYLSEEYNKSAVKKWMLLEEQFKRGCSSPVIYIEALNLLNGNPTLLLKLSAFEIQVLYYASRNAVLTEEVVEQIRNLITREREFSQILYEILAASYKKNPSRQTLNSICTLLIKGGKTEQKYFEWYEEAVEQEIRLTRLYDYYMLSYDVKKKKPIPKMVLMYYSYHSDLDYERNACLYLEIHNRREEFQELYLTFLPHIEQFVEEQICKGHINEQLSQLYNYYFKDELVTEKAAEAMADIVFIRQVYVNDESYQKVVVRYPHVREERVYPIVKQHALIPVLGNDTTILFEDKHQQRFVGAGKYIIEKLLLSGKILKLIQDKAIHSDRLNLYFCDNKVGTVSVERENEARIQALISSKHLEEDYRRELILSMIQYYYDVDKLEELDAYLTEVSGEQLTSKQRNVVLKYFVQRDFCDKAYQWLEEYGMIGVDPKTVVRVFDDYVARFGMQNNLNLTQMSVYAFQHEKYNENILQYLVTNYQALTKELRDLWKAAKDFAVDTYELNERMIVQMLFTGSFVGEKMEIFKDYVKKGAKAPIEEAFLSQCAYDYFVRLKLIDEYVFEEMLRVLMRGEELQKICALAVTKYYADNLKDLTTEQKGVLAKHVKKLLLERIHLPYMRKYIELVSEAGILFDKIIIEYCGSSGSTVLIHYVIEQEQGEAGVYRTEKMHQVFGGVCFKEFQLFFGESIQYYITEENGDSSQLTESNILQKSDIENSEFDTKYDLVNDIVIGYTLQDYDTVDGLLEEYERTSYLTNNLFHVD